MKGQRVIFKGQNIVRDLPCNIQEADKNLFQNSVSGWSRETRIQFFENVSINNELFIKEGFKFQIRMESFGDTWQDKKYNRITYQTKSFIKNLLRENKRIEKALWCFDQFSTGGYFHWITEIAPRLWVANQYVDSAIPLLLPAYFVTKWSFSKHFLEPFKREIIPFDESELPVIDKLTFIGQTGGVFNYQPIPIQASTELLKKYYYDIAYPLVVTQRIYISRKASGKRMILNEAAVEQLMTNYGYKIIYPEQLTLRDQINIFSRTSHLASIHGAGLSNMVFMPAQSAIIEIRHKDDNHMLSFFYTLAHTFNHSYYYSFGKDMGDSLDTELRPEDKSMHADIDMLREVLDRVHGFSYKRD